MKRNANYRYFVYQHDGEPYRVYGTYRYYEPEDGDPRCAWQGDDYQEALEIKKLCNNKKQRCEHAISGYEVNSVTGHVWCFRCTPPKCITSL